MYSLKQIYNSLESVTPIDGDKNKAREQIASAITALKDSIDSMEELQISGRFNLDTLLGCMMAVEQIIGEGDKNG